jgi:hypothetical protein
VHDQLVADPISAHAEAAGAERAQADDGTDLAIGGHAHGRQPAALGACSSSRAAGGKARTRERQRSQEFSSRRVHRGSETGPAATGKFRGPLVQPDRRFVKSRLSRSRFERYRTRMMTAMERGGPEVVHLELAVELEP